MVSFGCWSVGEQGAGIDTSLGMAGWKVKVKQEWTLGVRLDWLC